MVQLEDVTKAFLNGVVALRHVSLRIEPGEFVFVVGPTGTGKSTLLRLVYRDELPTSGRVIVYRRDVGRLRSRGVALLRRRLGVVFQDFKLLPARTAYDNVAFALRVIGTPGSEIRPRALRALALVGLEGSGPRAPAGRADRLFHRRSPGQLPPQRVDDRCRRDDDRGGALGGGGGRGARPQSVPPGRDPGIGSSRRRLSPRWVDISGDHACAARRGRAARGGVGAVCEPWRGPAPPAAPPR